MWESRSDFQGLWETKGNLGLVFLVFHAPVLPRRRIPAVDMLLFTFSRHGHLGHSARPVKVQIRIEVQPIELVESLRMRRGDVAVTDVLADHPAVFRFRQPVVVAQPRLGLLYQQFE